MSKRKKNTSSQNFHGSGLLLNSYGCGANNCVVLLGNNTTTSTAFISTITIEPKWLIPGYSEKLGIFPKGKFNTTGTGGPHAFSNNFKLNF